MKQAIRDAYGMGTNVSFSGRGSMVPNENCYCEIDPDGMKDKWGIPVLRFHWKWSDYELNQARHMRDSFTAILETLGGTVNAPRPRRPGRRTRRRPRDAARRRAVPGAGRLARRPQPARRPAAGGRPTGAADDRPQLGAGGGIIHEVGCVRMGTTADNSVVNSFCQVHDVPNVFSPTAGRSSATPTRTRPTRSSRSRGAPRSTSPRK